MKFNSNRMESLISGDRIPSQATFDSSISAQGSFIARIKRTGFPTKHIGWVDLMLLDSERLAVCHSLDSDLDEEHFLLFPLISGAQFGDVKRHGNALTLHAMRVSLVLEAETTENGDDHSSALAGKWTRILNRIISGEPSSEFASSNSYFGGLGISVNGSSSAPHLGIAGGTASTVPGTKPLVPQPSVAAYGIPQNAPTGFSSMVNGTVPMKVPAKGPMMPPSMPNSIPNSRSLKRISLCLTGETDLGFGDDLKSVLTSIDKEEDEEVQEASPAPVEEIPLDDETEVSKGKTGEPEQSTETEKNQITREESVQDIPSALLPSHEFNAPNAPFHDSSSANTPSPNSLYLPTETPSSPALDFGVSPKRLTTILAKEQQQLTEKYGNRASMFTSGNYIKACSDSHLVMNREPPKIPAPMPGKKAQKSAKSNPLDSKPQRSTLATNESSAKTGPAIAAKKTVSISPMVQIIKETEKDNTDSNCHRSKSAKMTKGASPSSPRPSSLVVTKPLSSQSPKPEHRTGFVKVMKRMLGKNSKQKKDYRFSSIPYHIERPEPSRMDSYETQHSQSYDDDDDKNNFSGSENEDIVSPKVKVADESFDLNDTAVNDEDEQSIPTPVSIQEKHHAYAELVEPDMSPLSQKFEAQESKGVVADATNNGGATMAVPKLNSSKSISALSFRSLSSRSLSSKLSDHDGISNEGSANTTAASTPEHLNNSKPSSSSKEPVNAEKREATNAGSPTMLRRESRQNVDPVPITLDSELPLPSAKTLYENSNNSTPALLAKRQTTAAAPVPHLKTPSTSSSNYSLNSKRSLHSYSSSLSSASSYSTPNLLKSDIALFGANLWVSVWSAARWKPVSQLELRTDILASDTNTVKIIVADTSINCKFTPQCEIRKVGNHDVEVKSHDNTYMFRGRDPEDAQRFYRTLWTIQVNGVQPVATAALTNSASYNTLRGYDDDESILQTRRRTLLPPSLSRSNQSLRYAGLSTETIMEE